jgi:hypothetical protein
MAGLVGCRGRWYMGARRGETRTGAFEELAIGGFHVAHVLLPRRHRGGPRGGAKGERPQAGAGVDLYRRRGGALKRRRGDVHIRRGRRALQVLEARDLARQRSGGEQTQPRRPSRRPTVLRRAVPPPWTAGRAGCGSYCPTCARGSGDVREKMVSRGAAQPNGAKPSPAHVPPAGVYS